MGTNGKTSDAISILLVEDHIAIREALAGFLDGQENVRVVAQSSRGTGVAKLCIDIRPTVLLLDVELPDMSGFDVCREVKQVAPDTRVLIFTSMADDAVAQRALQCGALGILEKAADMKTLLAAVRTVAEGRAYLGTLMADSLQRALANPPKTESPSSLTQREREILQLVAAGNSNKEVATRLGISLKTAENHRHNLMRKLDARNAADLTREAFRLGLLKTKPAR